MNILLINDDGVHAPGIHALKKRLKKEGHNVFVVAPEKGQSAKSQAITLTEPLRITKYEIDNEICWGVNGFPADCVFMGILELHKDVKFDLVISGINNGANVGFDVNYSGTVGAAREALSYDIPCMASSLFTHDLKADFTPACNWTVKIMNKLFETGIRHDCVYNLNVPYTKNEHIQGFVLAPMSGVRYFSGIEKRVDPYGRDYYFITGDLLWEYKKGTDADMLHKNYVTLTPLEIDYTDHTEINRLKTIFDK